MPSAQSLASFVKMVVSGDHVGAIETWYHADASMQENGHPPREGRDALVQHEAAVMARARGVSSECVSPPWCDGDRVVIHWRFSFDWANGTRTEMEELALQEWRGERILRERFFYDPAQLKPKT
jgi:ketosteroid isomerase-like protein